MGLYKLGRCMYVYRFYLYGILFIFIWSIMFYKYFCYKIHYIKLSDFIHRPTKYIIIIDDDDDDEGTPI